MRLFEHRGLLRPLLDRDGDVFHLGVAVAGFRRVKRPGSNERESRLALPAGIDDDGVLQRGTLADELPVLQLEIDEVPVEARIEARGERCGDVGGEHRRAEDDRVEVVVGDHLGEHIDARLRQRRLGGVVGHEYALAP